MNRKWKRMDDKQFVLYGLENHLVGLRVAEIREADSSFYQQARKRRLADMMFLPSNQTMSNPFFKMNDEELIEYFERNGRIFGLRHKGTYSHNLNFYREVRRRGLDRVVFRDDYQSARPSTRRDWSEVTNTEIIRYAEQKGYIGRSSTEVRNLDTGFRNVIYDRGLQNLIFKPKQRRWHRYSNEQLIKYAEENGLYGLNPRKIKQRDKGFYEAIRERHIIDEISKRKLLRRGDIVNFLKQNEAARSIALLAGANGYSSDVAAMLIEEWPERFPSYEELVKEIPQFIRSVGLDIGRIEKVLETNELNKLFASDISSKTKHNLENVLCRIGVEEYQTKFNENPTSTLTELNEKQRTAKTREISQLFGSILNYYQNAYNFKIPGYGSLGDS